MINCFVTYRCNLACPYCFARPMQREHPRDMSRKDYTRLLGWLTRGRAHAVALIGGEPTLHPHIEDMALEASDAGLAVVLFTNGLCDTERMERLACIVSNTVVNYNDPDILAPAQRDLLHANLAVLRDAETRLTFSKNFSSKHNDYAYLLEGIDTYRVDAVRYDVSRPAGDLANDHFGLDQTRDILAHVTSFVRACEERGVRTGLDCSVRLCDMAPADRAYLQRVSMKCTGVCHPSIDVHPDLSASYCLPLADVRVDDVTAFAGTDALMRHFNDAVRPLRTTAPDESCADCADFGRRCQGGCLALKRGLPGLDTLSGATANTSPTSNTVSPGAPSA